MTVKKLGQALVHISDLGLPDDMDERMESELVQYIARTERDVGIIHPPLVRKKDMQVIAGRNRVAARLLNGHTDILIEYASMTNKEMVTVEKVENAFRKHDADLQAKIIAELYEEFRQEEQFYEEVDERPREKGRPTTPEGRAVKRVVELTATSERTVRRAIKGDTKDRVGPPIHTWGLEVDPRWLQTVRDVQGQMAEVRLKLRRVKQVLGTLINGELSVPKGVLNRIQESIREVDRELATSYPKNLCPACKAVDAIQVNCGWCRGAGWVGEVNPEQYDPKLLDEENPVVWNNGELQSIDDVIEDDGEAF